MVEWSRSSCKQEMTQKIRKGIGQELEIVSMASSHVDRSCERANSLPDREGRFGDFGGRYMPETLMPLVLALEQAWREASVDARYREEIEHFSRHYIGRPSPLYFAERMTEHLGGAKIYFKRDELNHTGAHKINNCLGQILLAKRMGKRRIVAETGAGQHGVATASVCARFGLPCVVYMGAKDIERQSPNVYRMRLLGCEVVSCTSGSASLKDAMNEAIRDWVGNVEDSYYLIGSVAGPHPYPEMVRDLQAVIGRETRAQLQEAEGRLPDLLVASVGGGSNALGLFHPFLEESKVRMLGVEAAGKGTQTSQHAATLTKGSLGILHGSMSYVLQDAHGQIQEAHSISAGLDYPGVGPEHAFLKDSGRVEYVAATDEQALDAFDLCAKLEGILPALEPSHALAAVVARAPAMPKDALLVVNLCGRGDKDIFTVARARGETIDGGGG